MAISKIYLHWSATGYSYSEKNRYHTIVQGDGKIFRIAGYDQTLQHTWKRNTNSAGLACACMGGVTWKDFPPTPIQLENMCREAAALALSLGWKAEDITDLPNVSKVMTHAEAAANRDFSEDRARLATGVSESRAIQLGLPHDNYGPSGWPDKWPRGTIERWDFFKIKQDDPNGSGGDKLRAMIRKFMNENTGASPIEAAQSCKIFVKDKEIGSGLILEDSRCYVKLLDIIKGLGIELGKVQPGEKRFINLVSDKFKPKFLADTPLVAGFPTVDIYLNRPIDMNGTPVGDPNVPVKPFLGGILIEGSTYILAKDICEELALSLTFKESPKRVLISNTI